MPSSAKAQAQLEAEIVLFSFNPDKPMGRTDKPMGRADKPMGHQPGKVFLKLRTGPRKVGKSQEKYKLFRRSKEKTDPFKSS